MKNHSSLGLSSALSLGYFICSVLLNQCNISTYMFFSLYSLQNALAVLNNKRQAGAPSDKNTP